MLGRTVAQNTAYFVIDGGIGGMVFAVHFKIHTQCRPAGAKIRLPLQFNIPLFYNETLETFLVFKVSLLYLHPKINLYERFNC